MCVLYIEGKNRKNQCVCVSYEGRGVEICSWESQDRHTVFVDWRERGGGLCVYGMVGSRGEGWWFGPGDCKSLWPALMSSGWATNAWVRDIHQPARVGPPYWSHIVRHPTPPRTLFYSYARFCSYTVKVTYSPFLTFQEKECLWLYFLFFFIFSHFFFLFNFNFFTSTSIPFLFSFPCKVLSCFILFPFSFTPNSFFSFFLYLFFHVDTFYNFIFFPFSSIIPFLFFFLHYSSFTTTLFIFILFPVVTYFIFSLSSSF